MLSGPAKAASQAAEDAGFLTGGVLIGMRRHYAGYFRGLRGASPLRAEWAGYRELAPLMARLEELRDTDPERIAA